MVRKLNEKEIRNLAANTFNQTWDYIEKSDRSTEEDELMLHCAHASRYFWGLVGTPLNFQRGDWLISKVYTLLNRGTEALRYAKSCLQLTEENNFGDFDRACAYEIMSRAYAGINDKDNSDKFYDLAIQAAEEIENAETKTMFLKDLREGNWFKISRN